MSKQRILFVGDRLHREFHDASTWLAETTSATFVQDAAAGLARLHALPADWIVIAQSRPGQFRQSEIEQLQRAAPLARLVALLGSWCEGETRSGDPWHGVTRVCWHQWPVQAERELCPDPSLPTGLWKLPRTFTDAERILAHAGTDRPAHTGLVAVDCYQRAMYAGIAEACAQAGLATVWLPRGRRPVDVSGVSVVIWDGIAGREDQRRSLTAAVERFRPAPAIALLDFLRWQDQQFATQCGAVAALAKPYLVDDLIRLLGRYSDRQGRQEPVSSAA